MEPDKATRIYIALAELVDVTDGINKCLDLSENVSWSLENRLMTLVKSQGYTEMKQWLEGKKK